MVSEQNKQHKDENNDIELTVDQKIQLILEELNSINAKLDLLSVHTHGSDGRVLVPY